MWILNLRKKIVFGTFLVLFLPALIHAEDRRTIPLDMYLIIDGSSALKNGKQDTIAWIGDQVVDRILMDGDKITIWAAGDKAQVIYSETLSGSAGKKEIRAKLQALDTGGKSADFSGALREAAGRISQGSQDRSRLAYTMLVTASARGLEPVLTGNSQGLLRWFRSEEYARWQVLIVAPDIGNKVRRAAAAYMSSVR
jgi:hypothetical protein